MGSMIPEFLLISCVLFFFLNNVYAGVTSTFIRSEWPSVDIPLDNEVFVKPNGHNAPEQVLLSTYISSTLFILSVYLLFHVLIL